MKMPDGKTEESKLAARVKLDLESNLENIFALLQYLPAAFLLLAYFKFADKEMAFAVTLVLASPIVVAIGFFGRKQIDNFYLLDTEKQTLVYHFQFASYISESVVANQFDMAGFGVQADKRFKHQNSAEEKWFYAMFLALKSGKKIFISDFLPDARIKLNERIGKFARAMNIRDFPAPQKFFNVIERDQSGEMVVKYSSTKSFKDEILKPVGLVVVCMGIFALIIYLSTLV